MNVVGIEKKGSGLMCISMGFKRGVEKGGKKRGKNG